MTGTGNPEEFPGELPEDFTVLDIVRAGKNDEALFEDFNHQLQPDDPNRPAFEDPAEGLKYKYDVGIAMLDRLFECGAEDAFTIKARWIELRTKPKEADAELDRLATVFDNEREALTKETEPDNEEIFRLKQLSEFAEVVSYIVSASVASALSPQEEYKRHIEGIIEDAYAKAMSAYMDEQTRNAILILVNELRGEQA